VSTETQSAVEEGGAIVITDARVDAEKFVLHGIDTSKAPVYSIGEAAKVFFARTSHWIRWLEREGKLTLDGEDVGAERSKAGMRTYNLNDIEAMIHALAENKAISGSQARLALAVVAAQAGLYGYL
jgi:hypothetical protein